MAGVRAETGPGFCVGGVSPGDEVAHSLSSELQRRHLRVIRELCRVRVGHYCLIIRLVTWVAHFCAEHCPGPGQGGKRTPGGVSPSQALLCDTAH